MLLLALPLLAELRVLAAVLRWLSSGWRLLTLFVLAVATVLALVDVYTMSSLGTWLVPVNGIALAAALLAVVWAWGARSRLVVAEFVDATGDKSMPVGLSSRLVSELTQLRQLYRRLDDPRPLELRAIEADQASPIRASVQIDDVSSAISEAVTSESTIGFGPVKVPVGALMTLLARLLRGPRITATVHKDGVGLLIIARVDGSNEPRVWTVTAPQSSPQVAIDELACRVFADVALGRRVSWKAAGNFSAGLREYARCLYTRHDVSLHLRRAERHFIEALAEDQRFTLAYYNLGVVYRALAELRLVRSEAQTTESAASVPINALEELGAADSAFEKAIAADPSDWRGYYGLALNRIETDQADEAILLCMRILELDPHNALAHDLAGKAAFERDDIARAREHREMAALVAWGALLRTELQTWRSPDARRSVLRRREIARDCLRNLGLTYAVEAYRTRGLMRQVRLRSAEHALRRALELIPSSAETREVTAILYGIWDRRALVVAELEAVTRIAPSDGRYWARLAAAYARAGEHEQARTARARAYAVLARHRRDQVSEILTNLGDASRDLGDNEEARRATSMQRLHSRIWELSMTQLEPRKIQALERMHRMKGTLGQIWDCAQIALALAERHTQSEARIRWLREAVDEFRQQASATPRVRGLHVRLSIALRSAGKFQEALREAELGLKLDPVGSEARREIAAVRLDSGDPDFARSELETLLLWSPQEAEAYSSLSMSHYQVSLMSHDRDERIKRMDDAIRYMGEALELYPAHASPQGVWARFILGRFNFQACRYQAALSHFRAVAALDVAWPLPQFYYGFALLRMGLYSEATQVFHENKDRVRPKLRTGFSHMSKIGGELGESWTLGELHALLLWGLAYCYALQGVLLDDALGLIARAETYVSRVDSPQSMVAQGCHEARGWVRFQQGKTDECIEALEKAATLGNDPETLTQLARACSRKLEELPSSSDADRRMWEHKLRNWLDQARLADHYGEHEKTIEALTARLVDRDKTRSLI